MNCFIAARIRTTLLALLIVPGFGFALTGCGDSTPQGEAGPSVQTTQEELDQMEAEMESNEMMAD